VLGRLKDCASSAQLPRFARGFAFLTRPALAAGVPFFKEARCSLSIPLFSNSLVRFGPYCRRLSGVTETLGGSCGDLNLAGGERLESREQWGIGSVPLAQKPLTVTGSELPVVVPLPSAPSELSPQHRIEPPDNSAQVCH
jgi:hypothetical protein